MKKAIGFLLCTAFYGIFFYWVKRNYGDEIVPQLVKEEIEIVQRYVLLYAPGIFMVFFCSVFSYLCFYKTRFGWALVESLGISFFLRVLIVEGTNTVSVFYYIYLVVLWLLSINLSFVGSGGRSFVRSGGSSYNRSGGSSHSSSHSSSGGSSRALTDEYVKACSGVDDTSYVSSAGKKSWEIDSQNLSFEEYINKWL